MNCKSTWYVISLLALAVLPATGFATFSQPQLVASGFYNDHYYEVYAYPTSGQPDKTWPTAKEFAEGRQFEYEQGLFINGHLATITSSGEDGFIESLRQEAQLQPFEAWVGGFQNGVPCGSPDCNWTWVNGEGLFIYTNWLDGEPNDNGGEEQYLGIGLGNNFGWNDERVLGNIGGLIVEFDVPISAEECLTGCEIAQGSTIILPETVELTGMSEIDVRRYEFTDDPALCGTTARLLFGPLTDPDDLIPDAILPAYLCGSPNFLVVVADTTDVTISTGTILVENQADETFPDNLYDCTGPFNPDPQDPLLHPDDPQNRDVMAYQTTDLTQMPENDLGATNGFEGSVGEFTFECGSSRGKGNLGSLYFSGLHIDFGPGFDIATNPDGNLARFADLTRYKLIVLQDVILESEVALNSNSRQRQTFRRLKAYIERAIELHDQGLYSDALLRLQYIDNTLQRLTYTEIPGENYQGETEMRNSNAIFMYTDKVIR